ncbi:MAG: formylglycine-generating enzyme family protein [Kiritimatiellae bacterium]|nr:formylglycine-generating enzyme family protein [Kiritimatiellia bacterium]
MKSVVFVSAVAVAVAAFAAPTVTVTSIDQDASFNRIKVSYSLTEDAVVTWSAKTNAVAVDPQRLTRVWGDINRKVSAPGGSFEWVAAEELADFSNPSAPIEITLTAWPTNAPPDYMVVHCAGKSNVTYYVDAASVPGGVTNDLYKTKKMVMRKIPAVGVTWKMGSPSGESGRDDTFERLHDVTLTEDYYIGIYPVTQDQFNGLVGSAPGDCAFRGLSNSGMRPVENYSYYGLRGNGNGVCWAATNPSHRVSSTLLTMRNATGIKFDFPTDAQWEYACRAGTSSAYNDGTSSMDAVGWNSSNWANDPNCSSNETHVVGLLKPNAWGLYDMHGNVAEWVLDWHHAINTGAAETDPAGANTAGDNYHFMRGGRWDQGATSARSAYHGGYGAFWKTKYLGFRLVAPAAGYWKHE